MHAYALLSHTCTNVHISTCTQAVESAVRKVGGQGHPLGPDGLLHKAETKHLSWNPKERLSLREWAGLWVLRSSHVTIGKYEMTYLVGLFRGVAHVVLGAGSSMVSMNLESQGQAVVGGGEDCSSSGHLSVLPWAVPHCSGGSCPVLAPFLKASSPAGEEHTVSLQC